MRRITVVVMGTLSALVALFSYHTSTSSRIATVGTGTPAASTPASDASTPAAPTSSGVTPVPSTPVPSTPVPSTPVPSTRTPSGGASSAVASGSSAAKTYTGDAVDTRWGVVQVEITVAGGKITKSEAVQYPDGNPRDYEINAFAVPELNAEAVQQQSGQIDAVSGATVTSDGYIQSLQSAVDQAHL